ncbi:MAG: RNA-binding domain-containing protein [Coriobacteriales bacterium]
MAIPANIDDLVNQRVVESTRVEFKAGFNPNAVIHTICAFANDIDNLGGGYILIGVEEHEGSPVHPVKGIPQGEVYGILKQLVGLCHKIEPLYNPIIEPVLYEGSYIIVIWVPGGYGRPYKAAQDVLASKSTYRYYIRRFSSTIVASPDEEKELFYAATDIPFDDRPNLLATVDDLDLGLMREHLKEVGSALYEHSAGKGAVELAQDMQLVSGPPEELRPLNVGILMFCEDPQRFFRYARIEVVDIPVPGGSGMEEAYFTGPIQRQLRDALAYIKNRIIVERVVKLPGQAEAQRISNYPFAAVEEILSNAVYHRSYQVPEPITVRVTPQGIEVSSFPGFSRSITDEDIARRSIRARRYRNRRIGDFLKELGLIEGRNTGFPNAYRALELNGSAPLAFEMDEARSYLAVTIPVHEAFLPKRGAVEERDAIFRGRILELLEEEPCSLTELAKRMGYKSISRRLSRAVDEMVGEGTLERVANPEGRGVVLKPRG